MNYERLEILALGLVGAAVLLLVIMAAGLAHELGTHQKAPRPWTTSTTGP